MGDGKGARDKGIIFGIELAFDPVRPDPIEVVLNHTAVDKPACVEHDTGAQQFDRFTDLGGLLGLINY